MLLNRIYNVHAGFAAFSDTARVAMLVYLSLTVPTDRKTINLVDLAIRALWDKFRCSGLENQ